MLAFGFLRGTRNTSFGPLVSLNHGETPETGFLGQEPRFAREFVVVFRKEFLLRKNKCLGVGREVSGLLSLKIDIGLSKNVGEFCMILCRLVFVGFCAVNVSLAATLVAPVKKIAKIEKVDDVAQTEKPVALVETKGLQVEFDKRLRSRIAPTSAYHESEWIEVAGKKSAGFSFQSKNEKDGKTILVGANEDWEKSIEISKSSAFTGALLFQVTYKNLSSKPQKITRWRNHEMIFGGPKEEVWAYMPASHEKRANWVQEIKPGRRDDNYLGMNNSDYGGGTPMLALWSNEGGVSIGSAELSPKLLRLPIYRANGKGTEMSIEGRGDFTVEPGKTFTSLKTFVLPFKGDAFTPLRTYSQYLQDNGKKMWTLDRKQMGPLWCAWGYGRNFTVEQVMKTLPLVKEMGFQWVGLDDGWQKAIGDWDPDLKKFPKGGDDIRKLVDEIHRLGMKAQLWWAPLAAFPKSDLFKQHPEYLLKTEKGGLQNITWWESKYLCPAYPPVREYTNGLVKKFMGEWGFDGLKIDGQHLNATPTCFNKEHHHAAPEDSYEMHSELFKEIMETAKSIRKEAVVETCPCGTTFSAFNLPYQNMTVASDPENSRQVREKGKFLRAITGDDTLYFGDHVELSDGRDDFASSVGIGALVGTNFTLPGVLLKKPKGETHDTRLYDPKKEIWKKWITLAKEKHLWDGAYLGNLYDIAFDRPEAHVVKKDANLYFGFYEKKWNGPIVFRGLDAKKKYQLTDYVNHKDLGVIEGPVAYMTLQFRKYLLLEAKPL